MIRSRFSIYVGDSPRAQEATRIAELLRSCGNFFDIIAGIDHVHATVDFPENESVNTRLRDVGIYPSLKADGMPRVSVYLQQKHEREDAHSHA